VTDYELLDAMIARAYKARADINEINYLACACREQIIKRGRLPDSDECRALASLGKLARPAVEVRP